jgi:hypothetical protein
MGPDQRGERVLVAALRVRDELALLHRRYFSDTAQVVRSIAR